jgi:hypothetical protein
METVDYGSNHFIHVRSRHSNALHGGRAVDGFCPLMPSIPGFGFFDRRAPVRSRSYRARAELMQRFGYTCYVAQGGESGAPISSAMARQATAGLLAIYINLPATVPSGLAAVLAAGIATPHAWHRNEKFPRGAGGTEPGVQSPELLAGECFELLRCTDRFARLPMRHPHAGYDQDVFE